MFRTEHARAVRQLFPELPQFGRRARPRAEGLPAIVRNRNSRHAPLKCRPPALRRAAFLQIPLAHRGIRLAVLTGTRQREPAVAREGDLDDGVGVALESMEFATLGNVPEPHRAIAAAR